MVHQAHSPDHEDETFSLVGHTHPRQSQGLGLWTFLLNHSREVFPSCYSMVGITSGWLQMLPRKPGPFLSPNSCTTLANKLLLPQFHDNETVA